MKIMSIKDNKKVWMTIKVVASVVIFVIFLQTAQAVNVAGKELSDVIFYEKKAVVLGETSIVAKMADSQLKREKGLSGSEGLDDKEGMLFVFPEEDDHGIWMKDMNYPIDIIWIDEHFNVIHFEENVKPDTYPRVFKADKPSKYIIEVKAGFVDEHRIRRGDPVIIL